MKKGTTKALHTSEVGLTKPGPAVIPKVCLFVCSLLLLLLGILLPASCGCYWRRRFFLSSDEF